MERWEFESGVVGKIGEDEGRWLIECIVSYKYSILVINLMSGS